MRSQSCVRVVARVRLLAGVALAISLASAVVPPVLAKEPEPGVKVGNASFLRKLVPVEQVEQTGTLQYSQLLQKANQQGAVLLENHPQVQRLRKIAQDLLPQAYKWNDRAKVWNWEVNLFRSPTINAFCMPGGKIAFFTGILEKLNLTDDEVAMIMGHEIAHALREHARERMAKSKITGFGAIAIGMLLGDAAGQIAQVGGGLYGLKFGRNDETEADLIGMEMAARAGYDPRAGISLWEKMSTVGKGQPPQWLSTHPSHATRIDTIRKNLPAVMPLYERASGHRN
jgi:predicted Zn-dependent protease